MRSLLLGSRRNWTILPLQFSSPCCAVPADLEMAGRSCRATVGFARKRERAPRPRTKRPRRCGRQPVQYWEDPLFSRLNQPQRMDDDIAAAKDAGDRPAISAQLPPVRPSLAAVPFALV